MKSAVRVIYIDSSALLKLFWQEPESDAVRDHVAREDVVIVSTLTELEATRLLTHDTVQARAARALGFAVLIPGNEASP